MPRSGLPRFNAAGRSPTLHLRQVCPMKAPRSRRDRLRSMQVDLKMPRRSRHSTPSLKEGTPGRRYGLNRESPVGVFIELAGSRSQEEPVRRRSVCSWRVGDVLLGPGIPLRFV